ncbi:MAG: hypothetical protein ACKV2O_24855 [Acidimicrobiales bacterium]
MVAQVLDGVEWAFGEFFKEHQTAGIGLRVPFTYSAMAGPLTFFARPRTELDGFECVELVGLEVDDEFEWDDE